MNRSKLAIAAALLLATAASATAQQRVYQWKDASGVTHYADMPPTQTHKTRDIDNKSGNATDLAAVKTVESPQCQDARGNLKRLQGGETLGVDTDGDGKVSRAEFKAVAPKSDFDKIDKNHDGFIDEQEAYDNVKANFEANGKKMPKGLFEHLKDQDGV